MSNSLMAGQDSCVYQFGEFQLDPTEKELKRGSELLYLPPKEFDTLLLLVRQSGHLVEKQDLMTAVWGETTVEEGNINLIISNLRKALGDNAWRPKYIQTVRKRGFRFIASVNTVENRSHGTGMLKDQTDLLAPSIAVKRKNLKKLIIVFGIVLFLAVLTSLITILRHKGTQQYEQQEIQSPFEELEVKRVVRESQIYETLTIYTDPKSFDRSQLAQYWVPADLGGKEVKAVDAAIDRLLQKGWRYEKGSRLELFEFRYVKILAPGDHAELGTIERWYLPTCREDGSRVLDKNVYLGPQAIDYKLRKINGKWLIDETTVPRPHA
jgi:DNA-binding winged helix-turn-helix (wHTH) protein